MTGDLRVKFSVLGPNYVFLFEAQSVEWFWF